MADERKPKKKPRGIGDEIAGGVNAMRNPGYAAYKREAEAMGDPVMTPEQWAAKQKRK
jgi:hypothetical protein